MDKDTFYKKLQNILNLKYKSNKTHDTFLIPSINKKICTIHAKKDLYTVWYNIKITDSTLYRNNKLRDVSSTKYPGELEQVIRSDMDVLDCIEYLKKIQEYYISEIKPKTYKSLKKSEYKSHNINEMWNIILDHLHEYKISKTDSHYTCRYNNKQICIFFLQKNYIRIVYTTHELDDILPPNSHVIKSSSPHGKHEQKIQDVSDIDYAIKMIKIIAFEKLDKPSKLGYRETDISTKSPLVKELWNIIQETFKELNLHIIQRGTWYKINLYRNNDIFSLGQIYFRKNVIKIIYNDTCSQDVLFANNLLRDMSKHTDTKKGFKQAIMSIEDIQYMTKCLKTIISESPIINKQSL